VLADALRRAGYEVVVADLLPLALAAAQLLRFNAGLLDIQLGAELSYPVARVLAQRCIPFAFVSGGDPTTLPPDFAHYPFLRKPIHPAAVIRHCESFWAAPPASAGALAIAPEPKGIPGTLHRQPPPNTASAKEIA
jgi:CheY-like chemotaxis protein